jgi:ATP-dependent protease ClpP protease subunit
MVRRCNTILAKHCGQPYERVEHDTQRDYFMTAQEAVDYGLIDAVLDDDQAYAHFDDLPATTVVAGPE